MQTKKIGDKIRTVREMRNLTQEFMAQELDITPNGYGKLERGESKITFDKLEKIAEILEIGLTQLIDFDPDKLGFNNAIKDNEIHNNQIDKIGNVIICELAEKEQELYEKQITRLESEIVYLKDTIEFLKAQLQKTV